MTCPRLMEAAGRSGSWRRKLILKRFLLNKLPKGVRTSKILPNTALMILCRAKLHWVFVHRNDTYALKVTNKVAICFYSIEKWKKTCYQVRISINRTKVLFFRTLISFSRLKRYFPHWKLNFIIKALFFKLKASIFNPSENNNFSSSTKRSSHVLTSRDWNS